MEENQSCLTTFFTLTDVDFEKHDSSNYDMSISSLNKKEVYEENCHVPTSISETKEIESKTSSLTKEIRDSSCEDLIIDHFITSPLVLGSSYSKESNEFISHLYSYDEHSKVSDNLLCSDFSVDRVTDINQFILEEETKSPIDLSFEDELFSEESSCNDLSYP